MLSVGIIGNDFDLIKTIETSGYFKQVKMDSEINSLLENEILMVSDKLVGFNEFIKLLDEHSKDFQKIFYMLSNSEVTLQSIDILKSRNVKVIPPKLTINQILERVCEGSIKGVNTNKRVITFFGADSKVGVTNTVQGICESLAKYSRAKILLIQTNKLGTDFVSNKDKLGIDHLRAKLFNNILSLKELKDICIKKENLFILPGPSSIEGVKYYYPKHMEYIIQLTLNDFDAIIIDAGSDIRNGLSIGSLQTTNYRYLITTQQETTKNYFDTMNESILKKLLINDFMLIVNKYIEEESLYTPYQLAELYKFNLAGYLPMLSWGWQSEIDKKTLYSYGDKNYILEMQKLCNLIASQLGIDYEIQTEEIKSWKKFIGLKK